MYLLLFGLQEIFRNLGLNYQYVIIFWAFVWLLLANNDLKAKEGFLICVVSIFGVLTESEDSFMWIEPTVLVVLLFKRPRFKVGMLSLCIIGLIGFFSGLYVNYYGVLLILLFASIDVRSFKNLFPLLAFGIVAEQLLIVLFLALYLMHKNTSLKTKVLVLLVGLGLVYYVFTERMDLLVEIVVKDLRLISLLYFWNPLGVPVDYIDWFFMTLRNNNLFFEMFRRYLLGETHMLLYVLMFGYTLAVSSQDWKWKALILLVACFERMDIFYII